MAEVKLSTGVVVTVDMSKITFGEWRKFFSGRGTSEQDDAFVEKITGIKSAELESMLRDDYRRIIQAIIVAGNKPLSDPNFPSESISP